MTTSATSQLLDFLLANDSRAAAAARGFSATGSWNKLIALAKAWNVIPQFFDRIRCLQLALPAAETAMLRLEFLKSFQRSASRATKAIEAIQSLEQAEIPVVAFKGIASIALLYGGPKHRTIHDADLLIQKERLPEAIACLEKRGFTRRGLETLDQYLRFVADCPGFAGNQALTLYGEDGSEIDLHWHLGGSGVPAEEILERAARSDLMKSWIPVVDAKDGFLLTVHHTVRENLAIESICRDLLDARLWFGHLRKIGQLKPGMQWAAKSRCKVAALAVANILRGYDDAAVASEAAALLSDLASADEQRSAASLAELFRYQLRHGRLGKDVFYLVHFRPWQQILSGLAADWSGYWQSLHTLEEQLGEEKPLIERLTRLARSIPSVRAVRLARELASIKFGTK